MGRSVVSVSTIDPDFVTALGLRTGHSKEEVDLPRSRRATHLEGLGPTSYWVTCLWAIKA